MEPARESAISALRALLLFGDHEEKKLRAILADDPPFRVKMQTQTALEKILRNQRIQSDKLASLEAKPDEI